MVTRILFSFLLICLCLITVAQPLTVDTAGVVPAAADSIRSADSFNIIKTAADSVSQHPDSLGHWRFFKPGNTYNQLSALLKQNVYYNFSDPPQRPRMLLRNHEGAEWLFYSICASILFLGLLRVVFAKYFTDIFRQFFKSNFRQKQIREQLTQSPLPSILFNTLFIINGGIYISLLLRYFQLVPENNFWWMLLSSMAALAVIYTIKYFTLRLSGWLFNIREATDMYIFIVFLINKLAGIFLIPFLLLIAFAKPNIQSSVVTVSLFAVVGIFLYRFVMAYIPVYNEVKISRFHFLVYLCAFEVAPLLLIYKGLLIYF
jgi:Domain of unknown function (DUF4271)